MQYQASSAAMPFCDELHTKQTPAPSYTAKAKALSLPDTPLIRHISRPLMADSGAQYASSMRPN